MTRDATTPMRIRQAGQKMYLRVRGLLEGSALRGTLVQLGNTPGGSMVISNVTA